MTDANDEASAKLPTVLILTEEPAIYQTIHRFFQLHEERRASGAIYDVGIAGATFGQWQIVMPTDVGALSEELQFISDYNPTLIIIAEGIGGWTVDNRFVSGALIPRKISYEFGGEFTFLELAAPRSVVALLGRTRMRGGWPNSFDSPCSFEVRDTHAVFTASLSRTAYTARTYGVECLHISFSDPEDVGSAALIAAILRDVSPLDFSSPKPSLLALATLPPALPPTASAIDIHGSISSFDMRSLRMFDHLHWQSPPLRAGWQVILGDNASGKTSLLRALALCLLDRSERDALRQSWSSWLRKGTPDGSVHLGLADEGAPLHSLGFDLRRVRSPRDYADIPVVDIHSSEHVRYAGFLAAYGPFRRFTGGDADWIKDFKNHPRLQSVLTLFDERAALSDALEWLKDLWVRARTQKPTPPEDAFLVRLLSFINETGFLPEGVEILEPDADGVWCRDGNGQRVPATELSDGYRAVFSLVLDLLRRLSATSGYDKVFADDPARHVALGGIVLIDEVDAHLHPRWQQRIGAWFKERFPRVQFIVATHSPIVCQAADSVMLLPTPGDDEAPRMATPEELNRLRYGDLLDAFSTDFFGERVTRSQAGREKLDRLAELNDEMIARELTPEEQSEQAELRQELGTVGTVAPREGAG